MQPYIYTSAMVQQHTTAQGRADRIFLPCSLQPKCREWLTAFITKFVMYPEVCNVWTLNRAIYCIAYLGSFGCSEQVQHGLVGNMRCSALFITHQSSRGHNQKYANLNWAWVILQARKYVPYNRQKTSRRSDRPEWLRCSSELT